MHISHHALVIGGTGMLSGISLYLAHKGFRVSVIGRTPSKFEALLQQQPANIFPVIADIDTEDVYLLLEQAIKESGTFDLIVSWTPNYGALEKICELNGSQRPFTLIHVKGSRRYFDDEKINIPENCEYRKVFLGFILEGGAARWLSHREIVEGIIQQIGSEGKDMIVGQIEPYELRPE